MFLKVLVVDLDRHASETLRSILEGLGLKIRVAYDPAELAGLDMSNEYAFILVSPLYPKVGGMDVMDYLRVNAPETKLAVITERPDQDMEIALKKMGFDNSIAKPYSKKTVEDLVKRLAPDNNKSKTDFCGMIGKSPPMLALYDTIKSVADTDSSVLISGETGVGKELVASAIHKLGRRRNERFVTINCGALSESLLESELFGHERGAFTGAIRAKAGKFEYADGGTLFLDEIGEISANMQVKLLKVIETGELSRLGSNRVIRTNTRMLFATNRDLTEEVAAGAFRRDLFYRINVFPIHTPSLRERVGDIPALAEHFLNLYSVRHNKPVKIITPEAMDLLTSRTWDGNVRELENVIERSVIVSSADTLNVSDIDPQREKDIYGEVGSLSGITYRQMNKKVMAVYEKQYLIRLLTDNKGNISLSAKKAEMDRKTLYSKLGEHDIDPADFRKRSDGQ